MSEPRVVSIKTGVEIASPGRPSEALCAMLRAALQQAEAGEISGAILVTSFADGAAATNRCGVIGRLTAVGALELAKLGLLNDG